VLNPFVMANKPKISTTAVGLLGSPSQGLGALNPELTSPFKVAVQCHLLAAPLPLINGGVTGVYHIIIIQTVLLYILLMAGNL
jgi:hypothetical protein